MRFVIAASLYLIGLTLALVGIAQQTIWLPPLEQHREIDATGPAPFVIVDHKTLTQFEGAPELAVTGDSNVFLASGREADVVAWVGTSSHTKVSVSHRKLTSSVLTGFGLAANPSGSDLWRFEKTGSRFLVQNIPVDDGAAVLIANDGTLPSPTKITLTWKLSHDFFWSRTAILSGLGVIALGVIMNIWAWYHMRKQRGPRRRTPKAPQGPRYRFKSSKSNAPRRGRRSARNAKVVVSAALVASVLAGCSQASPEASPSPTSSVVTDTAPAVVTKAQAQRIIGRIATALRLADKARNAKYLADRVSGPALEARQAHYTLQALSPKIKDLPGINPSEISFLLPAASVSWPRVFMAVVASSSTDGLPQMLVLEQNSPRAQYNLWYQIDMLPGIKTPEVATSDDGAIPVAADSKFLKVSPNALPAAFGNLIDMGQASLSAGSFDVSQDEFYKQVAASQAAQRASLKNAKIVVNHSLGNVNVLSLSTADSGALVAVYMKDTYVIKPTKRNSAVAVSGNEKLLLGATGSAKGIQSVYGDMLLFYVPAVSSSDRIMTLGASQGLLSVRSL